MPAGAADGPDGEMSALVGRFAQCVVAGTAPATAERQLAPYLSPSAARQVAAAGAPDPR